MVIRNRTQLEWKEGQREICLKAKQKKEGIVLVPARVGEHEMGTTDRDVRDDSCPPLWQVPTFVPIPSLQGDFSI